MRLNSRDISNLNTLVSAGCSWASARGIRGHQWLRKGIKPTFLTTSGASTNLETPFWMGIKASLLGPFKIKKGQPANRNLPAERRNCTFLLEFYKRVAGGVPAGERARSRASVRMCVRAGARAGGRERGRASERADGRASGRARGRTRGRAGGRAGGRTDERADGRACGRADGRTAERAGGRTDARADARARGRTEMS